MKLKELMKTLEIDDIEDFSYFETFCDLMEMEGELSEEVFFEAFSAVDFETLQDLSDSYLEEIIIGVPDDCMEIYTLLSSYKSSLEIMMRECSKHNNKAACILELLRFRRWYAEKMNVKYKNQTTKEAGETTLFEALIFGRLEKLAEGKFEYDFNDCLDFNFEIIDTVEDEFEEDLDHVCEHDCDHDHEHHHHNLDENFDYESKLIDPVNPVIDGEMYEGEEEDDEQWKL